MSRADLLRAFSNNPKDSHTSLALFFGYDRIDLPESEFDRVDPEFVGVLDKPHSAIAKSEDVALRMEKPEDAKFWYLDEFSTRTAYPVVPATGSLAPIGPRRVGRLTVHYFEPTAHWLVELDRLLGFDRENDQPDINRCVQLLSQRKPLISVPREKKRSHAVTTRLLIDQSRSMRPAFAWQFQIRQILRDLAGKQSVRSRRVRDMPVGSAVRQRILNDCSGSNRVVLLTCSNKQCVSDDHREAWQALIADLQNGGHEVISIEPSITKPNEDIVENVLACAIDLIYPKVETILALVRIMGGGFSEAMAVWNHHSLVSPGGIFQINQGHREYFQDLYHRIPSDKLQQVAEIVRQHRAEKFDCQIAIESLLCAAKQKESLPDESWLHYLTQTTLALHKEDRADFFAPLQAQIDEIESGLGHIEDIKTFVDLVTQSIPEPSIKSQPSEQIYLVPTSHALQITNKVNRHAIFNTTGPLFDKNKMLLNEGTRLGEPRLEIFSTDQTFTITNLQKPTWADRIYRDTQGRLIAAHQSGTRFEKVPASVDNPASTWRCDNNVSSWASDTGIDDHGLWADLTVDNATYRLRWIPPGEFNMGSPENEDGRGNDEHLHKVTLTTGFWLGETIVTKQLWHTIIDRPTVTKKIWRSIKGENLSEQEQDLPASNISWGDCARFIDALSNQVPMFSPRFPTEAEWEYACRAGTTTAFWWGDTWSDEHGNNGNAIKAENLYPENVFGLKSMHGNLWEWCNDWYGDYPDSAVTDPQGPETGQSRVLRGGTWFYAPRSLRAAYRYKFLPVNRSVHCGFRLAGGDPQASQQLSASVTADRDEGTESQRGGQARRASRDSQGAIS